MISPIYLPELTEGKADPDNGVTVVVTVGPLPHHRRWLQECLDSVAEQTFEHIETLIITDGARIDPNIKGRNLRVWRAPFSIGSPMAANFGVYLAGYSRIFLLASDDLIRPWCISDCIKEYLARGQDNLAYYSVDIDYSTGERQGLPSGPAMVTKALWAHMGGYPVETSVAADYILVSLINVMKGRAGRIWHVPSHEPPYWHRVHDQQEAVLRRPRWGSVIGMVKDVLTIEWDERFGK